VNRAGRHYRRRSPAPGQAGFSLAELLVALSLTAVITGMAWSFYRFTHSQVTVREEKALAFDNALSLLDAVSANIRQSRATVSLGPSAWVFITRRGDTASYAYRNDTLYFNRLALTVAGGPPAGFAFSGFGSDSALDIDGDREVVFRELDLNNDRRLDGPELRCLTAIRAAICLTDHYEETLATVEAVKNNLQYDEGTFQTYF
jgi:prepilin-type N-terminal cleavage/methylation domain-containing protein